MIKNIVFFIFLFFIFASCQSDEVELETNRVALIKETISVGQRLPISSIDYNFEYDGLDRLVKMNDRVYHYGSTGKVDYSRLYKKESTARGDYIFVERLSYHWDGQGRLMEVVLDSLYERRPAMPESISSGDIEALWRDVSLASYSYEGNEQKPSTVTYRKLKRSNTSRIIEIGASYKVAYSYEEANVVKAVYKSEDNPQVNNQAGLLKATMRHSYLSQPHYLREVYKQLGFHPYVLEEVVSDQAVSESQVEGQLDVGEEWTVPEGGDVIWKDYAEGTLPNNSGFSVNGRWAYDYRVNSLGYPLEVVVRQASGAAKRTLIHYN